ncbi:MAG: hypothetical protein DIU68_013000 [Chloroflexota bacterium]|nr:MAG: hypothetical protein DIU68_16820 [Chloroflexota bacterium]
MASDQNPTIRNELSNNGLSNEVLVAENERQMLDTRILAGEMLPPASLMAVLRDPNRPEGELLLRYAEQLLDYALQSREAEAAVLITRIMDEYPFVDAALYDRLNDALMTEPDSVYALIRARMNEGVDERWLERLKVAALCALQVAITDGDSETASNWLRLVAREPAAYELGEIVHYGLLAAAERARQDGELGRLLIPIAVRRDPAVLEILLNDSQFIDAMAEVSNLGRLLRDYEGDVMQTLQKLGYEAFLLVLARAAQARKGSLFTSAAVEQVWAGLANPQAVSVPPSLSPEQILKAWLNGGVEWLDEGPIQTLLTLALRDRRDDVFYSLAHQLASRDNFVKLISTALHRSGRPEDDVVALVAQLMASGDATPQIALDLYVRLLVAAEWRRSAMPIILQLTRMLQHYPGLAIPQEVLWQLLAIGSETKDETILRIVVRRMTADLEATEDEATLVEHLIRLVNETHWHAPTRQYLLTWWRGYAHGASLGRLQRLDKAMDGKRPLEELRTIVQTVLAFRKLVGKRTLQQFAEDVGIAYNIIQALSEAFDPSPKRVAPFDLTTLRAELEARSDELTPHEQQIMANNFKELAQLIASMGDNRSKASLRRRGDDIDRLLMTGEQQPHSAVDTLKWLAGYLSGSQEKEEAGEE